jgi:hypothetical protein
MNRRRFLGFVSAVPMIPLAASVDIDTESLVDATCDRSLITRSFQFFMNPDGTMDCYFTEHEIETE